MQTFGIIGFPLGHSFSKKYFTEKFEKKSIKAQYLNFEIEHVNEMRMILDQYPNLKGFNVTIPHKQNIIPLLDNLSEEASLIGAVNCVRINRTGQQIILTGYNTDVYGFKLSLQNFIPENTSNALILGNGGAAKAVRYVLNSLNIKNITVSRTPQNKNEVSYAEIPSFLPTHKLIINTTPLGTWPNTENYPDIPYQMLDTSHYLFDLVYNPEITEFMKRGALQGSHVRNGMEMLIGQAEKAWEIWTSIS